MLVLVHGFRGDHHGLEPVVAQLPGFRIVSPDLPGFGESATFTGRPHDIDAYADWLAAFIGAIGIDGPYALLGHSFGSIVAANAVARGLAPERLVLVNPIGAPALEGPRGVMTRLAVLYYRTAAALPERAGFALLRNGAIVRVMSVTMAKTRSKPLRRWIHDQHDRYFSAFGDRDAVLEAFRASVSHDVSEFAADIHVPTLLVAAERDDVTPLEAQRRLVTLFPDAKLEVIPEVGHLIHYETPGDAAGAHPPIPARRGARVRIVVDCRYTRIGQHDGISRFTAGIVAELGEAASAHHARQRPPPARDAAAAAVAARERADEHPRAARRPAGQEAAARHRVHADADDGVVGPRLPAAADPARPHLLREPHSAARPAGARAPAVAAVPPGLVAAADAAQSRRRRRHRLARPRPGSSTSTTSPTGPSRSSRTPPTTSARPRCPACGPSGHRLVYMGSYMPYKNVDTLVRAVAALPDHELHLMSRIGRDERARLTRLAPQARLVFHDGVSDAAYAELLAGATALVHASRAEGFGIPLVEAMRLGTPVVVSDIPIFREIGDDAALYFDPGNPESLVSALWALEREGEWERRSAASVAVAEALQLGVVGRAAARAHAPHGRRRATRRRRAPAAAVIRVSRTGARPRSP